MAENPRSEATRADPAEAAAAHDGVDEPSESIAGHSRRRKAHGSSNRPRFRVPRLRKRSKPGAVAGLELSDLAQMPTTKEPVSVTCIDYGPSQARVHEVTDLPGFLAAHRPEWAAVRWINVDGLGDMSVVRGLAEKYRLHPLAVEDVLHVTHRPKVEAYDDDGTQQARLFIIARMLELSRPGCTPSRSASSSAATPS